MLKVCPQVTATNAPTIDVDRNIIGYKPYARVEGVRIAIAPTNGGCLTSGFGPRGGGTHKGVDIQTKPASMIHAAASGRVREAGFRADYGNYVVMDHGRGVFTRYAHLAALEAGVIEGVELPFGAKLGPMGATAAYAIPIHLHYEVLTGDYETAKKSFGLTPVNVFKQTMVAG
jgi:murein DD-endopeptidase MepM/ murein hydrolase activator NlpD